jgi:hypothetical protein
VAERHGAELTLDDAPAGGLRVTLRFAAAPAGKPAAPAPDAAAPARSEAASTP